MKLLALVNGPASISRYLATVGGATEVPRRSPGRGPPYWNTRVTLGGLVLITRVQARFRHGPRG
jgi:hypothetical protein